MSESKLNLVEINSNNKRSGIILETGYKQVTMRIVKETLKISLLSYQEKRRERDPLYCVYTDISHKHPNGFSPSNVYLWQDINNDVMADPEKLITLCDFINDYKPIEALTAYFHFRQQIRMNGENIS